MWLTPLLVELLNIIISQIIKLFYATALSFTIESIFSESLYSNSILIFKKMDSTNLHYSGSSQAFRLIQNLTKEELPHSQKELGIIWTSSTIDVFGMIDCSNRNQLWSKLLIKLELDSRDHEEHKESSRSNNTNSYFQNQQESILLSNQRGVVRPLTPTEILYEHYLYNESVSTISK